MNAYNSTNQQTSPTQPTGYEFVPPQKKWRMPKIPMLAQVSGLLSLLVIGAGLLTVSQLSQTNQDLQSQAATGSVSMKFEPETGTLQVGQDKTFAIQATTNPSTLKASASIIRVRSDDKDIVDVIDITPGLTGFPVELKPFFVEMENTQIKQWTAIFGANPGRTFSGTNTLANVKVKGLKAGRANIEIASNSEVAAFGNSGNVYDKGVKYLQVEVTDGTTPGGGTACVSKTADRVSGATPQTTTSRTPLAAKSKVQRGNTIEYKITVKPNSDSARVTILDTLPTHVGYVSNSLKLNGTPVTQSEQVVTNNQLTFSFDLAANRRNENHVFSYQVKVKDTAPFTEFTNAAKVIFNNNTATPAGNCAITLAVEDNTQPPQTSKLIISFKIQGLNKAGVTIPGEIHLRHPDPQQLANRKVTPFPATFVSGEGGLLTSQPVELKGLNIAQLQGEFEVFVKTPTTLRQRLGVVAQFANGQPKAEIVGDFRNEPPLFVGDFDRSPTQINVFRLNDVTRMRNFYTSASSPVTDETREFDINYDGVFNILDVSLIMDNYRQVSKPGATP